MIILTLIIAAVPLVLIIALFTHKGINAEAATDIDQPQQKVFDYLASLKNQEQFNAWMMVDPQMEKTYTGTDGEPGCRVAWHSKTKTAGIASQQLTAITAPQTITVEIVFEKPMPSKATYRFELSSNGDEKTHVNWIYEGNPSPYYLLRVSHILLRLKKKTAGYMEASLKSLKSVLEK